MEPQLTDKKHKSDTSLLEDFLSEAGAFDFQGSRVGEEPVWMARLATIAEQLPDEVIADIIERVRASNAAAQPNFDRVASENDLTVAEVKLLRSLAEGLNVPAHAEKYGISINTGRVHMQRLLEKTGANGQLDLVRMLYQR